MSACVLDTDVVIAVLDRRDAHHRAASRALAALAADGDSLLLSLINYAEVLVKPAERDDTLRAAIGALAVLGIELVGATPGIARDAARFRGLNVSLADGFALATARARGAAVATFDRRVRRALPALELELSTALR